MEGLALAAPGEVTPLALSAWDSSLRFTQDDALPCNRRLENGAFFLSNESGAVQPLLPPPCPGHAAPTVRGLGAILNHCTIAHISVLLVATAAHHLGHSDKLAFVRSFVPNFLIDRLC